MNINERLSQISGVKADRVCTATMRCEIKALGSGDDKGVFEGFGSTFGGAPDSFGDIIAKGAFTKTLSEHKAAGTLPALLWQHNSDQPIGRWLEMQETGRGLRVKGKLTLGVQQASEAHALMLDEAVDGLSIGFRTRASEPLKGGGRKLTDIELLEVSVVTMPANGRARVTGVKSAETIVTIRDYEAALRDVLGFAPRAAKRLASGGWCALIERDVHEGDLSEIQEALAATTARADGLITSLTGKD